MINRLKPLPFIALLLLFSAAQAEERTINADIWGDNWFALYLEDELLHTDSVPYWTEASKNKDSFSFSVELPAQLNIIARDFVENDSGLEYIGRSRQQIGDGGFSAQFIDAESGEVLAVSDESWLCKSIHRAPLNPSCENSSDPLTDCQREITEAPAGWMSSDFDDSDWDNATIYSERQVRPNRGYDQVSWVSGVKLIWAEDLELDNTVLCRVELN